jgi:hypothetical protein
VLVSQHAWECYWVEAIRSETVAGQQRAHTELEKLLANNRAAAPTEAERRARDPRLGASGQLAECL